jgi:hypothetical protein
MNVVNYVILPLYLLGWVLVPVTVAWAIRRWWKSEPRFELPAWRSYLALTAFSLGGLPVLLWFVLVIWAVSRGGFRFYDPTLLRSYGIGLLLGLGGFVASLAGKGKLRWPACFISFAMVFMWFVAASGE